MAVIHHGNQRTSSAKEERKQRCSDAWVQTITAAGQKVATARDEDTLALEIQRLEACRVYLEQQKQRWMCAPRRMPPTVDTDSINLEVENLKFPSPTGLLVPASVVIASSASAKTQRTSVTTASSTFATQNPFAAFEDDDDDESLTDNEGGDKIITPEDDNDDIQTSSSSTLMTMRRLLIRVLTTLSELHTRVTNMRRDDRDERYWTEGVGAYATVVECLASALALADAEHTRLFPQQQKNNDSTDDDADAGDVIVGNGSNPDPSSFFSPQVLLLRQQQLAADAQVVMIALEHATREREYYESQAQRRLVYLQNKLAPQWESRDVVKERMGAERWENNPRPTHYYARLRKEQERELRAIEVAMGRLEAFKTSLEGAYQRSQAIYETAAMSTSNNANNGKGNNGNSDHHRYNGQRPDYQNARVSMQDYPDPTYFGWIFTGSVQDSYVEFFERTGNEGRLVKIDWYFTTATIKTSMDHPVQGPNQLFGKHLTPQEYRQILENPRVHTSVRFRTRNNNNRNNSRGGGGGGGGRGGGRGGYGRGGRKGRGGGRGRRGNKHGEAGRGGRAQ